MNENKERMLQKNGKRVRILLRTLEIWEDEMNRGKCFVFRMLGGQEANAERTWEAALGQEFVTLMRILGRLGDGADWESTTGS